jgi:5'(3')-deoxyribonucleotidase
MNMALTSIYLDLDGVILDFMKGFADLKGLDRELFYSNKANHFWALSEIISEVQGTLYTQDDLKQDIEAAGPDFWVNLPKYPWADDLIELCRSNAVTTIMSAPMVESPSSGSGKLMWIRDNWPDWNHFSLSPVKHHMAHPGALLIDDNREGCELFRDPAKNHPELAVKPQGGHAYLFPQPWSLPGEWMNHDPLSEIAALIEQLKAG